MLDRFNTLVVHLFSRVELAREEGQGTVEYALLLAIVVGAVALAITGLGTAISTKLTDVGNLL
jgi:Flp pilus assembly pilin Flp